MRSKIVSLVLLVAFIFPDAEVKVVEVEPADAAILLDVAATVDAAATRPLDQVLRVLAEAEALVVPAVLAELELLMALAVEAQAYQTSCRLLSKYK